MADRHSFRNAYRTVCRRSTCVTLAVCLMVLGVGNASMLAQQQQGLKIRVLSAEEGSWDQRAMEFGSDVLTPPEEQDLKLLNAHPRIASDRSSLADPPITSFVKPKPYSGSIIRDGIPGYVPEVKPESSIDAPDNSSLLFDSKSQPTQELLEEPSPKYSQEPSFDMHERQQRFQRSLLGMREHILTEEVSPLEEEEDRSLLDTREEPSQQGPFLGRPVRVWRFALFSRLFGSSFLGRGHPSRKGFEKLFPWNRTPGRNQGVGVPLVNDSWRWAPFGAGWFMGIMDGNTLVSNWTGTKPGFYGGYHLNWDFDHYWGCEFRYGFASLSQWDTTLLYDTETHGLPTVAMRRRHATLKYGDISFLYYPWGDAKWRPYYRAGLGWGYVKFTDLNYRFWSNSTMAMPFGVGLKYRHSRRTVFRMELVDNFRFGERGINAQHNISFTVGIEIRFGGTRTAYWPYNPGRHYW